MLTNRRAFGKQNGKKYMFDLTRQEVEVDAHLGAGNLLFCFVLLGTIPVTYPSLGKT